MPETSVSAQTWNQPCKVAGASELRMTGYLAVDQAACLDNAVNQAQINRFAILSVPSFFTSANVCAHPLTRRLANCIGRESYDRGRRCGRYGAVDPVLEDAYSTFVINSSTAGVPLSVASIARLMAGMMPAGLSMRSAKHPRPCATWV